MPFRKIYLLLPVLAVVLLSGCAGAAGDSPDAAPPPTKKKAKSESQKSWLEEQFHRERLRDKSMNKLSNDDFEVFPGRKGSRSEEIHEEFKPFFWE